MLCYTQKLFMYWKLQDLTSYKSYKSYDVVDTKRWHGRSHSTATQDEFHLLAQNVHRSFTIF
jgi:hypothetical protein